MLRDSPLIFISARLPKIRLLLPPVLPIPDQPCIINDTDFSVFSLLSK
jgi:hypothetical protein